MKLVVRIRGLIAVGGAALALTLGAAAESVLAQQPGARGGRAAGVAPGVTHGPIIEAAMPDIFAFFAKHSR